MVFKTFQCKNFIEKQTVKTMAHNTRSSNILFPDVVFPPLKDFSNPTKLPLYRDVIGVLRGLLETKKTNTAVSDALSIVRDMIYQKYHHDTIYCLHPSTIRNKIKKDWEIFQHGKFRIDAGRLKGKEVDKYNALAQKASELYDVSTDDPARMTACQKEWGVTMKETEKQYLEDQRSGRRMECSEDVDPVWLAAKRRKQKEESQAIKWDKEKVEQFSVIDSKRICDYVSEDSQESELKETDMEFKDDGNKSRTFLHIYDDVNDFLPPEMRHIRTSERVVRDDIYECLADLEGYGLSPAEAMKALVRVAELFGRNWKILGDEEDTFDINTLPHEKNLRVAARQIETKGMASVMKEVREAKSNGNMITHAMDTTTKKRIGHFGVAGLHIGKSVPFPLPLFPTFGEATEDVAYQCNLGLEILSVVDGMSPADLYNDLIDTHMTDSAPHNKGLSGKLASMFDLDDEKGQLFCGTHTTLGFSAAMNKIMAFVERDMTLEAIMSTFMVDLEFDSKHISVAGQACDVILRLVAPEFQHKPWNYNKAFTLYLKENGADQVLFAYKDERFGCFSRACAVDLYIKPLLDNWLDDNPGISNRLACIVRDFLKVEYLDVAFTVFASFGIQLIEPFYATTIAEGATHSSLKVFYQGMFNRLEDPIARTFFDFKLPWFEVVTPVLFKAVTESYNLNVVETVQNMAETHMTECIKLANLIRPELQQVLGRQRRDYGLTSQFEAQYPIEKQASNVDDTPVHNIAMERLCGLVDYRAKKLGQLDAVSRSILLDSTGKLRKQSDISFRKFNKQATAIQKIKLEWSEKMKSRFAAKLTEKQAVAVNKEEKRLISLEKLKLYGGPFTKACEVDEYLKDTEAKASSASKVEKDKLLKESTKRMKLEMQFARDSSTSLPRSDPIFRIQVSLPNKKRRDKTAHEFGTSLKALLGKRSSKTPITLNRFKESLDKVSAAH